MMIMIIGSGGKKAGLINQCGNYIDDFQIYPSPPSPLNYLLSSWLSARLKMAALVFLLSLLLLVRILRIEISKPLGFRFDYCLIWFLLGFVIVLCKHSFDPVSRTIHYYFSCLVWFGSSGISTFVGYLMPKPSL